MESNRNNAIDPGMVRAKAYEIWQSLGCPDGAAEQTWFEAERQLNSRCSPSEPLGVPSVGGKRTEAERQPAAKAAPAADTAAGEPKAPLSEPPISSTSNKAAKKSPANSRRTRR